MTGLVKVNNKMKIKCFKNGYANGWEINFIGKVFNLRIARHQFAFWKNFNPVFNFKK